MEEQTNEQQQQQQQQWQFGVEEKKGGGKGKVSDDGNKERTCQRCERDEEKETRGARGAWPVGGAEEVQDGRPRNDWTREGEEEMQNDLTGSANTDQGAGRWSEACGENDDASNEIDPERENGGVCSTR